MREPPDQNAVMDPGSSPRGGSFGGDRRRTRRPLAGDEEVLVKVETEIEASGVEKMEKVVDEVEASSPGAAGVEVAAWPCTLRPQPLSAALTRRLYLSRKGGGRATKLVPGESVLGEKRVSSSEGDEKTEYRAWNPFHSKLGAAILGCVDHIHIRPGALRQPQVPLSLTSPMWSGLCS